ncbi:hypothetical protein KO506_13340 [Polaribacter vadi]|nr:hypothetical protein [Polaribacter vadi]
MRFYLKAIYFSILMATIVSCTKEYEIPQELVVHDFVWKGLNAYYLYQDQIEDLSDRRFSSDQELNTYLSSFTDYNSLFSSLLIPEDVKSTLVEDYNTITEPELRTSFTNGLEFGIIADPNSTTNVLGYVTHVLPNSDASTKNLIRGEYFYAVNGVQLTRTNYESLLLVGFDSFTLNMADFDGTTITPNTKTVLLEKLDYTYPASFLEKLIPVNADNIGYLMYNNDFSNNYINDLNNSFLNFKNQSVNELVLDLRYSSGSDGFAKNISKIASMITGQFSDEVLIKEEWNTKAQSWFLENEPDSLLTKFPSEISQTSIINSLNLTDVYIILNGENFTGSSATELLINSLKAHINVHIIGNQTAGNNTGSITLYNSEDYDFVLKNETHTVALQPVVLSFLNNNDETYENGFTPNLDLCDNEDVLDLGVLGEVSDPILNSVLNYISTGTPISNNNCNPNNYEYLFNSINPQRTTDNGVFIEQNLPNTN